VRWTLVVQALGDFEAIDGVRPIEIFGHEFGFVALNRPNAMPHQGLSAALQSGDFVYAFLNVVLSKIALPAGSDLAHIVGAEGFGNGQQLHIINTTATGRTSGCHTRLHGAELVLQSIRGGIHLGVNFNKATRMSRTAMTLHELLRGAITQQASDVHLSAGLAPRVRVHGALTPLALSSTPAVLTDGMLREMLGELMDEAQLAQLTRGHEVDFAFTVPTLGRFRANVFVQQHGCSAVMRHIPSDAPTLAALRAPKALAELLQRIGILLVTGPTGSGKSTTLASMVQHLNTQTRQHIVTLEDPIEFVHVSQQCLITQREIGTHSPSFTHALRAALREDPDVILVGELRDAETIRLALTAAETGHLVLASLHTRNAAAAVERIVDVFDAHEKALVRTQLSDALVGVVSQMLLPTPTGKDRVAVFETLVATPAIRHLIRESKTAQIQNVLQTGAALGMQTMEQARQDARHQGWIA
jgi:twitching motility protein PilT